MDKKIVLGARHGNFGLPTITNEAGECRVRFDRRTTSPRLESK